MESPEPGDLECLQENPAFWNNRFSHRSQDLPDLAKPPGVLTVVHVILRQRGRVVEVGGVPPELSGFGVVHGDGVLWRTHGSPLPKGPRHLLRC